MRIACGFSFHHAHPPPKHPHYSTRAAPTLAARVHPRTRNTYTHATHSTQCTVQRSTHAVHMQYTPWCLLHRLQTCLQLLSSAHVIALFLPTQSFLRAVYSNKKRCGGGDVFTSPAIAHRVLLQCQAALEACVNNIPTETI